MKRLALFICLIMSRQLLAQDYIEYQKILNRVDLDVLTENNSSAIARLDSVYAHYNFIYAKHCIKALQICIKANDSLRAERWLAKSFKQGIPIWMLRLNGLTQKVFSYSNCQSTLYQFDSLHAIYTASIDTALHRQLNQLLILDQKYTQRMNHGFVLLLPIYWLQWNHYNKRQYKELKKIIETHGYPEEKLIGISTMEDSSVFAQYFNFWGPSEIRDSRMQIMLQHCFSTRHQIDESLRDILLQNVRNGNMPPFQFALIISFMYPNELEYIQYKYFVNRIFNTDKCRKAININRNEVGLYSFEQAQKNTAIERERRKNKKANAEIVLE